MLTFTDDPPLWGPSPSHLQEKRTFPYSVGYRRQNTKLSLAGEYACEWCTRVCACMVVCVCVRAHAFVSSFTFVTTPRLYSKDKSIRLKLKVLRQHGRWKPQIDNFLRWLSTVTSDRFWSRFCLGVIDKLFFTVSTKQTQRKKNESSRRNENKRSMAHESILDIANGMCKIIVGYQYS